jgi:general secretion pathway protein D
MRVSELEFIDQGDWFITIPNIVYTFIKNSTDAELLASPQIRISDGEQATLHIGDRVPIPVTSFNTSSTIGSNIVPITSFQYQDIGIRLDLEPRIHHNKEISLNLQVEVSDLSGFVEGTAGQQQPIIGTRTIESTIRLMNGETNFLAGLIRTGNQRSEQGVPGLSDIPVLGRLFSKKRTEKTRTDLVLTLTPHIIRTPDITEEDLLPIWVGTEANITFRGGSPRVESEVEGPFDEGADSDAERIREMIRRRIQNLPRGLQGREAEEKEDEPEPGVDLVPAAPPGDVFRPPRGNEGDDEEEPRSLIVVPGLDEGESSAALDLFASAENSGEQQGEQAAVRLRLLPSRLQVERSSSFEIRIVAEAISPVSHLPITLEYDDSILSVEAVEAGDFLGSPGDAEVLSNHSQPGQIVIGASRLGDQEGVTGQGTVARVRFQAALEGSSSVRFAQSRALDADLDFIGPLLTDEAQVEVVSQDESNEGAAADGSDKGS